MIYFIQADGIGHIKIGFTDGEDASSRLATLQTGSPVPLRVLHTMPGTLEDEKNLHRRFASAGVGGEWFKPTSEMLALIPDSRQMKCEDGEVIGRSVSIRVLSVGRKQFSKSLLGQLAETMCIDWGAAFEHWEDEGGCELKDYYCGVFDIWGWVVGGSMPRETGHGIDYHGYRWIIFESQGRLYKDRDYQISEHLWGESNLLSRLTEEERKRNQLIRRVYAMRKDLIGWRDEDQLFIGV